MYILMEDLIVIGIDYRTTPPVITSHPQDVQI